jgi:hypothetical protein
VHVKASLVKAAQHEKSFRKAQSILQVPPAGQVWRSYYFQGAARLALRVQVSLKEKTVLLDRNIAVRQSPLSIIELVVRLKLTTSSNNSTL